MINKVILVGNVGNDPEVAYSQSGSKIVNFSLATSESWKDKATGERKTQTQWHRVVIFNENLAEIVEKFMKKGSKVYIEGALQSRKYTGNDGVERNITEVVLGRFKGEIQLLDSRGSAENGAYSDNTFSKSASPSAKSPKKDDNFSSITDELDDEIPF